MNSFAAAAPGKIIISGEHAVVHGCPAIVTAVDRFVKVSLETHRGPGVHFAFEELGILDGYSLPELDQLRTTLLERYDAFSQGDLPVEQVCTHPAELLGFTISELLAAAGRQPNEEWSFYIKSDVPPGCGMGASAAVILSLLKAGAEALQTVLTRDQLFTLAMDAEKLQHGKPSGADPYTCLHGGCIRFRNGTAEETLHPSDLPFHLVHSGKPDSTTGACVMQVTQRFGNTTIWDDFTAVTRQAEQALVDGNRLALIEAVRENHRLLDTIGVVPGRVHAFVKDVEERGGAAKVCGAGSVAGETAGMVLVIMDESPEELANDFSYEWMPVKLEPEGVRLLDE